MFLPIGGFELPEVVELIALLTVSQHMVPVELAWYSWTGRAEAAAGDQRVGWLLGLGIAMCKLPGPPFGAGVLTRSARRSARSFVPAACGSALLNSALPGELCAGVLGLQTCGFLNEPAEDENCLGHCLGVLTLLFTKGIA